MVAAAPSRPEPRRPTVLHMTQYLSIGGLESLIVEMCRNTDPAHFNRSVLCLNDCSAEYRRELDAAGVHVDVVPRGEAGQIAHYRRIAGYLREHRVDIVHGHSGCRMQAIISARLARAAGVVYTAHGHPLERNWKTWIEDHVAIALVSRMVGVSRELVDDMRRRMPEGRDRIDLILNGVDTDRFAPIAGRHEMAARRRALGLPETGFYIGSVGRIQPVKNYAAMLRAFVLAVVEHDLDGHLVLVGEGELLGSLRDQATASGVAERVHFLGPTRDVPGVLQCLDVFSLTSVTEGTSMALLEAMACGLAPVVTAVGGNVDVITHGEDGYLHAVEADHEFAASFARLAGDAELLAGLRKAARATIQARFSLASMMSAYEATYYALMSR